MCKVLLRGASSWFWGSVVVSALVVLLITIILFTVNGVESSIITLYTLTTLLVLRVLAPRRKLSKFTGSAMVVVTKLFVINRKILEANLTEVVDSGLLSLTKDDRAGLFLLIVLIASLINTFMDGANAITLVLPVIIDITGGTGVGPDHLLVPITFTDDLKNVVALVNAPSGVVIDSLLISTKCGKLSFFTFLPANLIYIIIKALVLLPLAG